MDGLKFATRIEEELRRQHISKGEFYDAVDITATAMYGWKRGAEPKKETVAAVEEYLGIKFADEPSHYMDSDTAELLEQIRSRPDLGVLLRSARDVPPSSVYELVSKLEKLKEDANN